MSQRVAGDPLSLPGSGLCPGVQEDLSAVRTDRDGIAEPAAALISHLVARKQHLRPFGLGLSGNETVTRQ